MAVGSVSLLAAVVALAAGALGGGAVRRDTSGNMNGHYLVASGANQGVPFNDDYASKGYEYFDVWAPEIATHYGQVFWTDQGNQPLPPSIVQRFANKTMAIVGYEHDQVMVTPTGQPGVNPSLDVSVPINWAYNHHYMIWMTGAYSDLVQVPADPRDPEAHGRSFKWVGVNKPTAALRDDPSIPTSQMFSEGNGGESRKSYHGYPKGFAQLIASPTTWHITPMQVDTRNRDCGVTPADLDKCVQFTPGPEPRQTRFGLGVPAATNYSGLLECPCNSAYGGDPAIYPGTKTKLVEKNYGTVAVGTCGLVQGIGNASECFAAIMGLGFNASTLINSTVNDMTLPRGCSVVTSTSGTATAYFNTAASTAACQQGNARVGQVTTPLGVTVSVSLEQVPGKVSFHQSPPGVYCSLNHVGVLKTFVPPTNSTADAEAALAQCDAYCASTPACSACSVDMIDTTTRLCQWAALPQCGNQLPWAGKIAGDISSKVADGLATITLSGPADVWFGVGFNAVEMTDQPYTLIVNNTAVIEQKIGTCGSEADHCPGTQLAPSITVVSTSVVGNVRTVVLTRPLVGATADHYTFDPANNSTIRFINAVGMSQTFAYHRAHYVGIISFATPGQPTCICDVGTFGQLCDENGTNCQDFVKDCEPPPDASLLAQENPTCNSRQYVGGLRCCVHGRIMLDADQPIRPELLRYHVKIRFWFQEYQPATGTTPASHNDLPRIYYQTEANAGEYDIPPAFATPGVPIPGYPNWPLNTPTPGTSCTGTCPGGADCECVHTIMYKWTVSNMRLIYAGGHCHAPSCISLELYRNDTGELLCRQVPVFGQGNVDKDKYDEAGYLALPPCLWGDDEGLEPSVFLPENTPLLSIKRNRNTNMGHYGEMASWQMRGVDF